jgi:hypothetical protein
MEPVIHEIDRMLGDVINRCKGNGCFSVSIRFHNGCIVDYQIEIFHGAQTTRLDNGCLNTEKKDFFALASEQDNPKFGSLYFDLLFLEGVIIQYQVKILVRFNVGR